ncbi:glutathione S-transferase [Roseibium hamelinense]|uniref:Glutathione S-transferase n=1 Tax=Roseibium hamelinense TaxID=150831 RepID=A0A562T9R2_9HYPH|nr:glutathione S-transferase family protein [Roseibium hamelinense]MTI45210.1 glutathione S-transferase family protein [Roseibium hamelinense]TWI90427.1 glutathione S-transferase [Roseibium hamelinense]
MTDLVFYTNPMSRGRVVRWMLEEIGQPYETKVISYGPEMKSDAYRAINPLGKVPALVHSGKVITECAAICAYLADAFPEAGLAPALDARADYYRWLFFSSGPMETCLVNRSMGFEVSPERQRQAGYGVYEDMLDVAEMAVSGKTYIAGGSFSAADVYFGMNLEWAMQFGTVEPRPAFKAYVANLNQRPAYKRATELDDSLIPADGAQPA